MKTPTLLARCSNGLAVVVVLSLIATRPTAVVHAANLRTVALTGQPAPGTPAASPTKALGRFSKGTSCITAPC